MLPSITAATRPTKLSGPWVVMSSVATARAPLPETGRISISGVVSGGMPSCSRTGAQRLERSSIAPEARNMLTAVRSPTSAGITRSKTVSPSSAPWVRAPYTSARCPRPHTATPASKTGITRELRLMAASFPQLPAAGPSRGRHRPTRWRRPIPPAGCRRESRSRRRHGRRPLWWAAVGWTRC